MTKRRRKFAGKRFAAIDHEVLDHPAFLALSARAKALVWLLLRRFNGSNNGKIPASARDIQAWCRCGWRQVFPTVQEVEVSRVAARTKRGVYRPGSPQASEWRLTFLPIGDAPATHDYRHPESQTVMAKTNVRSHSGSGAVPTVGTEESEKPYTPPGKTPVSVPTVGAENPILRSHRGITCKVPCRGTFSGGLVVGLVGGVSGSVDLPPRAEPQTADRPNEPDEPKLSERERHDQHVRTMRRWVVEGKSPEGLGARVRHWREAGRGWTRVRLAAETGLKVTTLAAMEAGRQRIPPETYEKIVAALAVDQLTVTNTREAFASARRAAAVPLPQSPKLRGLQHNSGTAWPMAERRALGLSQYAFAERAGVTRAYLATIEQGRRQPGPEIRARIERALQAERSENR